MKKVLLLLLGLTFCIAFISCQKKEDVIKVGIAGPMTGDQAKMGSDIKHGATLAVDEWNSKGGVLGKKFSL